MTRTHQSLFAGAALALVLPSLALAQEATTGNPGPAVDPSQATQDTTVTTDSVTATTDVTTVTTTEGNVTNVQVTSANEPMSLENWTYDELYASGISINEMVDADVYDPNGEDIGDVENVLFNMEGEVLSVVASIGGWLNFGDTHVNIPWEMVSAEDWTDGIIIPFTEDEVDDYIASAEQVGGEVVATQNVAEVGGDGPGVVETGPDVWRATDLLNNNARLREGEAFAEYGAVSDIVVQDGRIAAVLVTPTAGVGGTTGGLYGYPYAGQAGWTRGTDGAVGTYDMPYDRAQAERLEPFDPAMLMD